MEGWTTLRLRSEAPSHERCLGRKSQLDSLLADLFGISDKLRLLRS